MRALAAAERTLDLQGLANMAFICLEPCDAPTKPVPSEVAIAQLNAVAIDVAGTTKLLSFILDKGIKVSMLLACRHALASDSHPPAPAQTADKGVEAALLQDVPKQLVGMLGLPTHRVPLSAFLAAK